MQSHDFASTYVGTPFYMSPEICAAERYTLKSDIWSLGCIIYELCAREPPFNAKSHFQLVQKIKEGKIVPIPSVYSPELMGVIKDCLKVNPDRRPDTATLLNLPVVKLMRKEKEVVELARMVKSKEETAAQLLRETEERLGKIEGEKEQTRVDIEASVRREWEVKARLEIDRLVQLEVERLQRRFEVEVQERTEIEVAKRLTTCPAPSSVKDFSSSMPTNDIPLSSVSTCGDGDFSSTTDLTELSMDSPDPAKALKKSTRTPFTRAQTMFSGTPMDIEMAEPSPISIASLSLSPRRNGGAKAPTGGRNIFAAAGEPRERWQPTLAISDSEGEDDLPTPPSPTRQRSIKNPFRVLGGRLPLVPQKTGPVQKLASQTNIFATVAKANTAPNLPIVSNHTDLRAVASSGALQERCPSPNRRLSKIPSSACLSQDAPASPTRKPSVTKKGTANNPESGDLNKLAIKNNMAMKANIAPKGRTLVELAQARAGGRLIDANGNTMDDGSPKGKRFADRMAQREAAMWDPERDEMPSPFLIRRKAPMQRT
jgi:NIMA (never in mitosis gene a)-related kinase 2